MADTIRYHHNIQEIWDSLNILRNQGHLCDVSIIAGSENQVFRAHRIVLAANSSYFRYLLCQKKEDANKDVLIYMTNTSSDTVSTILKYMYTRSLSLTLSNALHLLPIAVHIGVAGIAAQCYIFLGNNLSVDNCIKIFNVAYMYGNSGLVRKARCFIRRNFQEVVEENRDFVHLSTYHLTEFLKEDDVGVGCEAALVDAVTQWIDYSPKDRSYTMPLFFVHIRLGLIDRNYFTNKMQNNPYIMNNPHCKETMDRVRKSLHPDICLRDPGSPLFRPRVPREVLFIIGGWSDGKPTALFETYDVQTDRWCLHPNLEDTEARAYHSLVSLDGIIYIIGGYDRTEYFSSMSRYDPVSKIWTSVGAMHKPRCYVSTAAADGCIYAMGGFNGTCRMTSVERYSPQSNQWTMLADMHIKRSDAGSDTVGRHIYIAGGFSGVECLNSVEVYDISTDEWTFVLPMSIARSGLGVIAHNKFLYVLGGFDGEQRLHTGEKYCSVTKRWLPVANMSMPRSNFAVASLSDRIYSIGGFNGNDTVGCVESYDEDDDEWHDVAEMNEMRSALKACVISNLPNAKDYTYHGQIELQL